LQFLEDLSSNGSGAQAAWAPGHADQPLLPAAQAVLLALAGGDRAAGPQRTHLSGLLE
jgi:hypothetical protein